MVRAEPQPPARKACTFARLRYFESFPLVMYQVGPPTSKTLRAASPSTVTMLKGFHCSYEVTVHGACMITLSTFGLKNSYS